MAEKMEIKYGDTVHNLYYRGEGSWYVTTYVGNRLDSEMNLGGVFANNTIHDILNAGIRYVNSQGV